VSTKNRSGRYSEIERREAIERERADQQVADGRRLSPMEGTGWKGRLRRQARCLSPVRSPYPRPALMAPATTLVRFTAGHIGRAPKKNPRGRPPAGPRLARRALYFASPLPEHHLNGGRAPRPKNPEGNHD
jgi:hypothetical protein